jgi:hypothetical protein
MGQILMYLQVYLRKGRVYVPTVAETDAGFYMNVEPVAVIPVADLDALRNAFRDVLARGTIIIPTPKRNAYPPSLLPRYAGVKTDRAFMQQAAHWSIDDKGGEYKIVGYRVHEDGYWVQDPAQKIDFSANSTVDDVIGRMIAILQETARQRAT